VPYRIAGVCEDWLYLPWPERTQHNSNTNKLVPKGAPAVFYSLPRYRRMWFLCARGGSILRIWCGRRKGVHRGGLAFPGLQSREETSCRHEAGLSYFDHGTGGSPKPKPPQPPNRPDIPYNGVPVIVEVTNCTNTNYTSCNDRSSAKCLQEDPVGKTCDVVHSFKHFGNGAGQWIPTPPVFPFNIRIHIDQPCQNCNNYEVKFAKAGVSLIW